MRQMGPRARLFWVAVMILGSAMYGVLISYNPRIASSIALGYIALILSIFIAIELWKRPHDR